MIESERAWGMFACVQTQEARDRALNGEEKEPRDLLKNDFEGFHGRFLIGRMKAREEKGDFSGFSLGNMH